MSNQKISIIIPNFNNGAYISDCIKSIYSQTHNRKEVIVVDDASTDNSVTVLENLKKYYEDLIVIRLQRNAGVSAARDIGIKNSTGQFICTVDSDDYFIDEEKLEKELQLILDYERRKNLTAIAFSYTVLVGQNKDFIKVRGVSKIKQGSIFTQLLSRTCEIPHNMLFRKELYFQAGGYNTTLSLYEDWDLKIRLAKGWDFVFSNRLGIAYRQHTGGLSSANKREHLKSVWKIYRANSKGLSFLDRLKTVGIIIYIIKLIA